MFSQRAVGVQCKQKGRDDSRPSRAYHRSVSNRWGPEMSEVYKDHVIKPIVENEPTGKPFMPRVRLFREAGKDLDNKRLEWPNRKCNTKEEAERLAVELAKTAIDRGEGLD